jgi:hypothetical protein
VHVATVLDSKTSAAPIDGGRRIPTIADRLPDQILTLTGHSLSSAVPIENKLHVVQVVAKRNKESSNFLTGRRVGRHGGGGEDSRAR